MSALVREGIPVRGVGPEEDRRDNRLDLDLDPRLGGRFLDDRLRSCRGVGRRL
jgi:hypothetical protein